MGRFPQFVASLPPVVTLCFPPAMMMMVPAGHASITGHPALARVFFYDSLIFMVLLGMIALAGARKPRPARARTMLLTMFAALTLLPLMMAAPLAAALPDTGIFNAWWEMVSSLTTTGASLYAADRLAPPLHLWRALAGWTGGLLALTSAIAIMSPLRIGGFEIMTSPYGRPDRFNRLRKKDSGLTPHISMQEFDAAHEAPGFRLYRAMATVMPIYVALTVALWILLLMAGDDGFLALIRALGTISTSGIAASASPVGAKTGLLGEVILFAFMFFALSRRFWPGGGELRASETWRGDPELRMAAIAITLVACVLFARHFVVSTEGSGSLAEDLKQAATAAWGGLFTALSYLTTTGWTSSAWADARSWSGLTSPGLMLAGLAMMGGGVATTAGGVKLLRIHALIHQSGHELQRSIHPSSVAGGGQAARTLRHEGAYLAFVFFMLFAITIAATVALISLQNVNFDTATILSVAALTNTGQLSGSIALTPVYEGSAGIAGAPWQGWAGLPVFTKTVLAAAMIIGRVETLAVLALFSPGFWRR